MMSRFSQVKSLNLPLLQSKWPNSIRMNKLSTVYISIMPKVTQKLARGKLYAASLSAQDSLVTRPACNSKLTSYKNGQLTPKDYAYLNHHPS